MALQKFAWVDPGSNLSKGVEKPPVIIIKFELKMIILSEAKSNTSVWYSSKYCNPANDDINGSFRIQDGGGPSVHLKLLQFLLFKMPAHHLV